MTAMTFVNTLAGIGWDPEIRGLLTVVVGVAVLMGSVYLLLATNIGNRLGFMLSLAGFFGWMVILGLFWWIKPSATGPAGDPPKWVVEEVNYGDLEQAILPEAHDLDASDLPAPEELRELTPEEFEGVAEEEERYLNEWKLIPESDTSYGEAKATVDAELTNGNYLGIDASSDYVGLYAFETGGKPERSGDSVVDRIGNKITNSLRITHPPHYALIQLCPTTLESRPEAAEPGQPPPSLECDSDADVISVIMERDLGQRRTLPALITIVSALLFGLLCYMLHVRDRVVIEHRSAPLPATTGS
jgi:hypothetical protein